MFKLKFQTQSSNSNLNLKKSSLSSRVIRDSRKFDSKGKRNESNEAMSWLLGEEKGGPEGF